MSRNHTAEAPIDTVPDRALAAEITTLAGRINDSQHRLLVLVAEYDRRGAWAATGATSCALWLAAVCDIEPSTAREHVRVARALADLPLIAAAFAAGDLSYAKVRTLTRIARPDTEAELLALAAAFAAADLARAIAAWAEGHLDPADLAALQHESRSLTWRVDTDGMVVICARLAPDAAAEVTATIDTLVARDRRPTHHAPAGTSSAGARPTLAQQRADALVAAVAGGGAKIQVEVLVNVGVRPDGSIWACLPDGTPVTGPGYSHLYDFAFVRLLLRDIDGRPIDATKRRRHPTPRQRRVIEARAGHRCQEPGCRSRQFLHVHHDIPYDTSHHTVTTECSMRCNHHHREWHRRH